MSHTFFLKFMLLIEPLSSEAEMDTTLIFNECNNTIKCSFFAISVHFREQSHTYDSVLLS